MPSDARCQTTEGFLQQLAGVALGRQARQHAVDLVGPVAEALERRSQVGPGAIARHGATGVVDRIRAAGGEAVAARFDVADGETSRAAIEDLLADESAEPLGRFVGELAAVGEGDRRRLCPDGVGNCPCPDPRRRWRSQSIGGSGDSIRYFMGPSFHWTSFPISTKGVKTDHIQDIGSHEIIV